MNICFRDKGVYAVHAKEDFDLFLDTVEKLGIDVSDCRGKEYIWPRSRVSARRLPAAE